ncbi:PRC-barrel domain-containing protein [Microvirga sp. BT688]|uniref:PRC-barrel domain-containing protein n=1 Tax=Microvirga sp. TaxID=1873136 RepID=UPI00168811A6|nr:PRC-barrel domain-containing protein [Microvirga sp.]MBD2750356.1 PRC-barrel domain-containing protein [Microvirga sp.]
MRMPQPDVNVAMAQPDVRVLMERPDVSVVQPDQPQVQVRWAEPRVLVQRSANAEPEVQAHQAEGQPTVRYEQVEVIVNRAQGQPNVRIERQDNGQQVASRQVKQPPQQPETVQSPQQQASVQQNSSNQSASTPRISDPAALGGTVAPPSRPDAQQQQTTAGSIYSDEQRRTIRERVNAGDADTTGAVDANAQMRPVPVSSLEDVNVYNPRGEELGEVDRVIVTPQDRRFVVVGAGGFLGIGRDRVAFPLERFWMRGDQLVIRGVTHGR